MFNLSTISGIEDLYRDSVELAPHHVTPTKLSSSRQCKVRSRPNTGLFLPSCTPAEAFEVVTERYIF